MRRLARAGVVVAGAAALLLATGWSTASSARTRPGGGSPPSGGGNWTGTFANFPDASWASAWGVDRSAGQNWGWADLKPAGDPARGAVLQVFYGKGSGANSCHKSGKCAAPGGGQFYMDLKKNGHAGLADAPALTLKYDVKFEAGFDFGRGGKLPGLYGGAPGGESGGKHDGKAFSTRYMWRNHPSKGAGELYFYSPTGSGYGDDLGLGRWQWAGDGKWHTVTQTVDRTAGTAAVTIDGRNVFSSRDLKGLARIPFSGVFFSTFFGGSDNTWGPGKDEHTWFANFSLTAAAGGGTAPARATPKR